MKHCTRCDTDKPETEFYKDKGKPDGLTPNCKQCMKERAQNWAAKNRQRTRDNANAWRIANPERKRLLDLSWRQRNIERKRATDARHYLANKERWRLYSEHRRARKHAAGGRLSPGIVHKLLKLQRGRCACCGLPLGRGYHLDHILPLVLGGPHTDANVQLLRARCNLQKNRKHPVDFMRERGFLL